MSVLTGLRLTDLYWRLCVKGSFVLFLYIIVLWAGVSAHAMTSSEAGEALLALMPKGASGKVGVMVKSLRTGKVIFAYNEGKWFVPASNAKVFVSAASLWLLKPDYRFKTEFSTDGAIRDGILYGDLYIKGYGDPSLTSSHLDFIAHEFKMLGITHVAGSVVVDDSYFDGERYGPGWKESWKGVPYSPPVSALTLNLNMVTIRISPKRQGEKPSVEFDPPGSGFRVVNDAVTANSKGGVRAEFLPDGETVVVSGSISPRSGPLVVTRAVPDPALYVGRGFKTALGGVGIRVEGGVRRGVTPQAARRLYTHFSNALSEIVAEYNKNSVNVIGENIIKTLGATFLDPPGSWEKGASVIENFTNGLGLMGEVKLVDGSGLSPINRATAHSLVEVLGFAYQNSQMGMDFIKSLSIGGVDGTLKNRFRALEGRLLAKTGYITGVRTLSGYLFTETDDVLAFSILSNGMGPEIKVYQERMLEKLARCCTDGSPH